MNDINSMVLKLSRNICAGKCGVSKTSAAIKELDEKFGDWDMPVELPDCKEVSQEQQLKKLSDTINSGVFSKEALIKMAELSEIIYKDKSKPKQISKLIIGGVVILIIIIGVVVIISIGGAK